jgi:Na+-transporting methylmalonyl-CoA/oxaloacetate decarboxylase beta subunit
MSILFDFLNSTGFVSMTTGNVIMIVVGIVFIFVAIK